jgi:hypothetical protein
MATPLYEVAHCRAGDKGTISTLSVFPYDDTLFPVLVRELTVARVRDHLARYVSGQIVRHELPRVCALHFVCHQVVDGNVTTSLALDTHGKTLSSRLLSLAINLDGEG